MTALVIGALVVIVGVATNALFSLVGGESLVHRYTTRRWQKIGAFTILILIGLGAAAVTTVLADTSSQSVSSARGSLFMWDASGLRPGIVYRDAFTPWADQ